jgi:predicted AAA+ superfamily ATPase
MPRKKAEAWYSDEELTLAIKEQNPWWQDGRLPSEFLRPFHRNAFYDALEFVDNGSSQRAVMLLGARRVGKTSTLYQLVNHVLAKGVDPKRVLFLSLDHPLFQFPNLRKLLEQAGKCAGNSTTDFKFILLDEIQYTHDWARWLKTLVQEPVKRRIVATGSAAATLQARGPAEGVGRWIDVHVPTLNLVEFAVLHGRDAKPPPVRFDLAHPDDYEALDAATAEMVRTEFREYLLRGGFPELARAQYTVAQAQRLLSDDIAEKVLNRDMAALFGVRQLLSLKQIFLAIAFRSSDIIDRRKLSEDFQVAPPTVNQYVHYLEQAFLVRCSLRYSPTENRVVKSHPKVYVTDSGLRNAVMRRGAAMLDNPAEMGPVVETAVFNQVFTWARENLATVYYWRNPQTDHEVDIVVRTSEGKLIPIEVKYQNQIRPDDYRGLSEFMEKYGSRVRAAYLVTAEAASAVSGVTTIPAHEFVWRLAWAATNPRVAEFIERNRIFGTEQTPSAMPPQTPGESGPSGKEES